MDDNKKSNYEDLYSKTLVEMPEMLNVDNSFFCIYPATLGTMTLVANRLKAMDINQSLLAAEPSMELLRLASIYPQETSEIIAFRSCKGKDEMFGQTFLDRREQFMKFEPKNRAVLLTVIFTPDHTKQLLQELKIEREMKAMRIASRAKKKDKNTLTFGAVTVYGQIIDPICEKYGWTYDYVMWGISYTNLQILLADATKELYLTDKERKRATILPHGNNIVKAEGMTAEQIRERFYSKK